MASKLLNPPLMSTVLNARGKKVMFWICQEFYRVVGFTVTILQTPIVVRFKVRTEDSAAGAKRLQLLKRYGLLSAVRRNDNYSVQ